MGLLLLWLLYRKMDFRSLGRTLTEEADWGILILASLFGTLGNFFRGWRWSILLEPLGNKAKLFGNSALTVQGNYAVNMVLPRLGEIWRCSTMKVYTGIPFSRLLGTVVVDRGMDVVVAAILAAAAAMLNLPFFLNFFEQNPQFVTKVETLSRNPLFWVLVIGVFLFLGWVAYRFLFRKKKQWESRLCDHQSLGGTQDRLYDETQVGVPTPHDTDLDQLFLAVLSHLLRLRLYVRLRLARGLDDFRPHHFCRGCARAGRDRGVALYGHLQPCILRRVEDRCFLFCPHRSYFADLVDHCGGCLVHRFSAVLQQRRKCKSLKNFSPLPKNSASMP